MIKTLPINSLYFDDTFHPRANADWRTEVAYKQSLMLGANFPPIAVTPRKNDKGSYLIIDGWHRTQAHKACKKENIRVEILPKLTDKQIYIESVRRNTKHGIGLTISDKTLAILRLKDLKVRPLEIAQIVQISPQQITTLMADRVSYVGTGESKTPVVIKSIISKKVAGKTITSQQVEAQRNLYSTNQVRLIEEIITMIQNDWIDWGNPKVAEKMVELNKLLQKTLKP